MLQRKYKSILKQWSRPSISQGGQRPKGFACCSRHMIFGLPSLTHCGALSPSLLDCIYTDVCWLISNDICYLDTMDCSAHGDPLYSTSWMDSWNVCGKRLYLTSTVWGAVHFQEVTCSTNFVRSSTCVTPIFEGEIYVYMDPLLHGFSDHHDSSLNVLFSFYFFFSFLKRNSL